MSEMDEFKAWREEHMARKSAHEEYSGKFAEAVAQLQAAEAAVEKARGKYYFAKAALREAAAAVDETEEIGEERGWAT